MGLNKPGPESMPQSRTAGTLQVPPSQNKAVCTLWFDSKGTEGEYECSMCRPLSRRNAMRPLCRKEEGHDARGRGPTCQLRSASICRGQAPALRHPCGQRRRPSHLPTLRILREQTSTAASHKDPQPSLNDQVGCSLGCSRCEEG